MTRTRLRLSWLVLGLLVVFPVPSAAAAGIDVPYLTGRVVDNANIMQADTRGRLAERLREHERTAGNQVVVLTVPTIGEASVEEYATKVFETWKLGQKDRDNGVLVVVVPQDRKMRIEVGYGLEASLTDATCGQIIRNVMTPSFKEGNYDKGIEDGIGSVIGLLEGTGTVPGDAPAGQSSSNNLFDAPDMPLIQRILIGAFIFSIIGLFTVIGVLTPGVGWFLYVFLIPFWAMFPIVVIGPHATLALLATYIIGYPAAKIILGRQAWYKKAAHDLKTKGSANIGGFTMTSGGSSSSSGWSSGGSSFSGGGGSSGGGGASGSW